MACDRPQGYSQGEPFLYQSVIPADCSVGAINKHEYLNMIYSNGFTNVTLQKEKAIVIPDDILKNYLDEKELAAFKDGTTGIFSITVYAEKPKSCCEPGTGCC